MRFWLIILNFVLNKLISVTDNVPLWVTKKLRNYWKTKSELHKLNIKYNRRKGDYEKFLNLTTNMIAESSISKKNYFNNLAEKLYYLKFHRKDYWGIFKSFKPIEKNSKHTSSAHKLSFCNQFQWKKKYFNDFLFSKPMFFDKKAPENYRWTGLSLQYHC